MSVQASYASIAELIQEGSSLLSRAGFDCARRESEWILVRLLNCSFLELYIQENAISDSLVRLYFSCVEKRSSGIPLQYILGEAYFYGERFSVFPGVFIPRPETEVVVQAFISAMRSLEEERRRPLRILELGVGSACIAVTVAKSLPTCLIVGVELSYKALAAASSNVARHGLDSRIRLVQGNWTDPIDGVFDGIISNPPYIPSNQVDHLPLDVREEPRLSLDGGLDGLRDLRHILTSVPRFVSLGGFIALECGEMQVEKLIQIIREDSWAGSVTKIEDLNLRPRGLIVQARYGPPAH